MRVNIQKLREIVSKAGAFPITIVADTEPKLKKGCPYKVRKRSKVNGMAGFIYENAVNRQRIREGKEPDFESEPRKWGIRIVRTPLVEHNGNFYLELKVQNSDCVYLDENGNEISKEEIQPFLRENNFDKQQLDKPVILRDYKLENIKEVHMDGKIYYVKN